MNIRPFVLVLIGLLFFSSISFAAVTVYVNGSTNACGGTATSFNNIQEAINYISRNTTNNGTSLNSIIVCANRSAAAGAPVVHEENVRINLTGISENLTISGNESGTASPVYGGVIINATNRSLPIFNISGGNVVISNFTFVGSAGSIDDGTTNMVLLGPILAGNISGPRIENISIENNTFINITNRTAAITITANLTTIFNNSIGSNVYGVKVGIVVGAGGVLPNFITIKNNTILGNYTTPTYGGGGLLVNSAGIHVNSDATNLNITNNVISNFTYGVYVDRTQTTQVTINTGTLITGVAGSATGPAGSSPNRIFNNTFGVFINGSTGAIVRNNNLYNNTYGVVLESANDTQVIENQISDGSIGTSAMSTGIAVSGLRANITSNNITNATQAGIFVNNFPTLPNPILLNISISGGNIYSYQGTAPMGISIGSRTGDSQGNPLTTAASTLGVNITALNITGNSSKSGSYGIQDHQNLSGGLIIRLVNISFFERAYSRQAANITTTAAMQFITLDTVKFFNNTYGAYLDDMALHSVTAVKDLARLDINSSTIFNNTQAGITIRGFAVSAGGVRLVSNTIYDNTYGIHLANTSNISMSLNILNNHTAQTLGYNAYLYLVNGSNMTNNSFLRSKHDNLYLEQSTNNDISGNNFTNATNGINFNRSSTSTFSSNNITNIVSNGLLLVNGSVLTFSGGNSIHLINPNQSSEVEIRLENSSNLTTFAASVWFNITTSNLIFALNYTNNVSIKVVNLSSNNIIQTNVTKVGGGLTTNGTVLRTLNSNQGVRGFFFGLNISATTGNGVVSPVFYFNATDEGYIHGLSNPSSRIAATTTGQNWTVPGQGTTTGGFGRDVNAQTLYIERATSTGYYAPIAFASPVWINTSSTGCGLVTGASFILIQDAVNFLSASNSSASFSGSTAKGPHVIIVCRNATAGHNESVRLNLTSLTNNITLTGNESGVLLLANDPTLPTLNVSGGNVAIVNFSFQGPTGTNSNIGAVLAGNYSLAQSENISIENNTFRDPRVGVTVVSNNSRIFGNTFSLNVTAGVVFRGDASGTAVALGAVIGNNFTGNASSIPGRNERSAGIWLEADARLINISNNKITNYTYGIYQNASKTTNSTGNLISGVTMTQAAPNTIYNNTYGILLNLTIGTTIRNNLIVNNTHGVVLENSNFTEIMQNDLNITSVSGGLSAIYLSGVWNNATSNNITVNDTTAAFAGIEVNNIPSAGASASYLNTTITGGKIISINGSGSTTYRAIGIGAAATGVSGVETNGVNITQINLTGPKQTNSLNVRGISFASSSVGVFIDRINVTGFGPAITSPATITSQNDNQSVYINNSYLFDNMYGFHMTGVSGEAFNIDVNNSKIYNNSEAGIFLGQLPVTRTGGFLAYNNQIYSNLYGIRLNQTSNLSILNNNFENNTFISTGGYGIYMDTINNTALGNNSFHMSRTNDLQLVTSRDNLIFDNNFSNITSGATAAVL
ncbi:right-handed parallel beta-helix repeat-containing protein, partial [Candidatus Micrarchaeota archaeon]|nr:right-handed parallel beta-helix repeat-containing protein [Candidatus Micrarchaeota archaeon]